MVATDFTAEALTATGDLIRPVTGWSSLQLLIRHRRGGTWTITGPASSGLTALTAGTRLRVRRRGTVIAEGYVTRIEDSRTDAGRFLTVSGINDVGLLADRLTLPTPQAAFSAQTADAYWTESGPAEFIIHRLITRNAGMGAHRGRQVLDSRVGTSVRASPLKTSADWTDVSTAGVTWSGNTATVNATSVAALRMTNALDIDDDMATIVGQVVISGACNITIIAYSNTTAAGAAPGQAGVITNTFPIHLSANTGAQTFWAAEVMRQRVAGNPWVRLQINVQAIGATRTVTFLNTGGVYTKAQAGDTVTVNTRFKNLAEEVEDLATAGGVVLDSDTANGIPRLLIRAGTDRSDAVKLSRLYGNVIGSTTTTAAPKANTVLVAGAGEGTARVTTSRQDTASLTEWGRRVEAFRDARDTSDSTTLDQRGDELLAESARTAGWNVDVIDAVGMAWPDAYAVGDTVAVVTGDVEVDDTVVGVEVTIDDSGEKVRPILGASELGDNEPGLYALVRDLRKRLEQLEGRR